MLPWEHVAAGYLLYSLSIRILFGRSPTGREAIAVVVASLLPDLIDKPLAWELHVVNGKSVGHSLSFAIPATVAAGLAAGRRVGAAVALGLLGHGVADVGYRIALGRSLDWTFLVWPLVDRPAAEAPGLLATTHRWLSVYGEFLASPRGQIYLLFEVALLGGALVLWHLDGRPGIDVSDVLFGRDDPLSEP